MVEEMLISDGVHHGKILMKKKILEVLEVRSAANDCS